MLLKSQNQREGAGGQDHESREHQDVHQPCTGISRMPPLPQPELHHSFDSYPWPVPTEVRLRAQQWLKPLPHDKDEAGQAKKMNRQEQGLP